jgi:DNA-directed RNA polymerase specialized sigma24 family protein
MDESVIVDRHCSSPEDDALHEELMAMVERALRGATPQQREAFLLFTLEGFRQAEIAAITGRAPEQVHADIGIAREHLRRSLMAAGKRRKKLVPEHDSSLSRSA